MVRGRFRVLRCGVIGVEAVEADSDHIFPRHTHEQFGIGVIERGAQKSLSGRGTVEAEAGDTITVNPGEVHDGAPIGSGGRSWRILYFDPPLIAAIAGDIREGTATYEFCRPAIRSPVIAGRFWSLYRTITAWKEGDPSLERDETLFVLLAELLEGQPADARHSVPNAVWAARRRIDDDPTASITLADLAKETGLSRFQTLRGFTRATGLTPHAYIVQRRINLARKLIARGASLADAAVASGFADQSHMTRIFVRNFGVSPGAYSEAVA